MHKLNSERGLSLVEATIILMILATMTAVIAPSMGDFLEDARGHKVKEDTESLGIGIARLLRDTGLKGLKLDASVAFTRANRVDRLESDGTAPALAASAAAFTSASNIVDASINWNTGTNIDTFEDQLVSNTLTTNNYSVPTGANRGRGWRGAYVNFPIGSDPWGYKYYTNTLFLTVATDGNAGTGEGQISGFWTKDVIVISGGADNTIQTAFGGTTGGGTSISGTDDVIFSFQGNSR
jgi:hypothetical protein